MRLRYLLPVLIGTALAAPSATAQVTLPFFEGFDYPVGDTLNGKGPWKFTNGTLAPPTILDGNVTLAGWNSGMNGHIELTGASGRKDNYADFTPLTSGSIYAAAVVNVTAATGTTDYFFHLAGTGASGFRARLGVQTSGTGYVFTFYKNSAGTANANVKVETTPRLFNVPVLVVIKYTVVEGPNNDMASAYILDAPTPTEPALPTLFADGATDITNSDITPGSVGVRQGSQASTVKLDGLMLSNAWPTATAGEADARPGNDALAIWGRRVRLTMDTPGSVNVALFDVLGREVATLHSGYASGLVEAALPEGLTPGVYVVRALGEGVHAAKTVVVR